MTSDLSPECVAAADPALPRTALRSLALQAELLDSVHDAVVVANLRGKVLYWNAGASRLSGWSRADAIGRELTGLLFGQALLFEPLVARLHGEGRVAEELRLRHKSGQEVWAGVVWRLLRDPGGQPARVLAVCTDVTARRLAEGELARSQALLDALQSIARLASVEVDHATGVVRGTQATTRLLGLARAPVYVDDLAASMRSASRHAFLAALEREDAAEPEIDLELNDGDGTRWVRAIFGPVVPGAGAAQVGTIAFQDITAARSAREDVLRLNASLERRVRRRTRQLEAANRELEAFSYSVSHDLKAPLTAIEGFAHALGEELKDRAGPRAGGYLDRIRAGVASMYTLIDVMLSLHRLSHQTPLTRRPVDLSEIARTVVRELREREPERACSIAIEPAIVVHGDQDLLAIAMRNLIGNAWKFSSRQPVTSIEVALDEATPALAVVRVADQGAGFDVRHAHKLFAPFQRLHHASEFPGTGVGLATVQRIVQRHGGSIRADAAPGAGATFWISLPRGFSDTLDSTREG